MIHRSLIRSTPMIHNILRPVRTHCANLLTIRTVTTKKIGVVIIVMITKEVMYKGVKVTMFMKVKVEVKIINRGTCAL